MNWLENGWLYCTFGYWRDSSKCPFLRWSTISDETYLVWSITRKSQVNTAEGLPETTRVMWNNKFGEQLWKHSKKLSFLQQTVKTEVKIALLLNWIMLSRQSFYFYSDDNIKATKVMHCVYDRFCSICLQYKLLHAAATYNLRTCSQPLLKITLHFYFALYSWQLQETVKNSAWFFSHMSFDNACSGSNQMSKHRLIFAARRICRASVNERSRTHKWKHTWLQQIPKAFRCTLLLNSAEWQCLWRARCSASLLNFYTMQLVSARITFVRIWIQNISSSNCRMRREIGSNELRSEYILGCYQIWISDRSKHNISICILAITPRLMLPRLFVVRSSARVLWWALHAPCSAGALAYTMTGAIALILLSSSADENDSPAAVSTRNWSLWRFQCNTNTFRSTPIAYSCSIRLPNGLLALHSLAVNQRRSASEKKKTKSITGGLQIATTLITRRHVKAFSLELPFYWAYL